jgi:hypothetical protein
MKKIISLLSLGIFSISFISGCGSNSSDILNNPVSSEITNIQSVKTINKNTNNKVSAVPLDQSTARQIARLFDKNDDGKIDAKEFKANVGIWVPTPTGNKASEQYENWDYLKNIPLQPIPTDAVVKALTLEKGDGYFYFGAVNNDSDVSEDDKQRIADGLSSILLKDSISKSGKIPVGTFKNGFSGTKILTEILSPNTVKKAIMKQFLYSPGTQLELSNRLSPNNDSEEIVYHRLNRIDHEYTGWFE